MKSPAFLLRALLTDVRVQGIDTKGTDRDFRTIRRRVKHEGDSFLSVTLPILGRALLVGLDTGSFSCPSNFRKKGALPLLFRGLLEKIFDAENGTILERPDSCSIEMLHQLCSTFKKLQLTPTTASQLERRAQEEYSQTEKSVKDVSDIPSQFVRHFERVCNIVLAGIDTIDVNFSGKHGPGSVCEGLSPNAKWRYTYLSLVDDRFNESPYSEWYSSVHYNDPVDLIDISSSCARVVSVPKNSTSVRLITVEPFLNQFLQGGLKKHLWSYIQKCPLKHCLALDHQEFNQQLALDGSLTGEFDTIDLKSASDLLGNSLVHLIFGRYRKFFKLLMSSRTPYASFGESHYLLEKYAGMGNATTFPIQSYVYALLGISAMLEQDGKFPSRKNVEAYARCIRVYGDDIITKHEYTVSVLKWIEAFGFRINGSKTFTGGNFRESCGVDAFAGVDITPTYVRHYSTNTASIDPKALCNMISCSNELFERALYHAAAFLKEQVEEIIGVLPLVSRRSKLLGWTTRQDAYTFSKWCSTFHTFKERGFVVKTLKQSDPLDDYPALLKFFHTPVEEYEDLPDLRPVGHLSQTDRRYKTSISKRWCHV